MKNRNWGALLLALILPSFAPAQEKPTAKGLAEEATKLFLAGKFDKAKDKFEEAIKLDPHPTLVFNLCKCFEKMGARPKATKCFEEYKQAHPNDDGVGYATAYIDESYQKAPLPVAAAPASAPMVQGTLVFKGVPAGATVKVDNEVVPADKVNTTNATWLNPGEHTVTVSDASGKRLATSKVKIESKGLSTWEYKPTVPATPVVDNQATEDPKATAKILRWVFTGVAVAAAGTGTVFGLQTLEHADTAKQTTSQSEFDEATGDGESSKLLTNVSLGIALAAGAAAGYFWWDSLKEPTVTPSVHPTPDGKGAGVNLGFSF